MKQIFYVLYACLLTQHMYATPNAYQLIYQQSEQCARYIFGILHNAARASYIGEDVSQLEHALQAAHQAEFQGESEELIIACLFHDIGHQLPGESMDGWGTHNHEEIGALFLKEQGFSQSVCEMVRSHIEAKRYLCLDLAYYAQLSEGSKQSLRYQGGMMSQEEACTFRQDPLFKQKITVRHCDDSAKNPHAIVPNLEYYFNMVVEHLYQQRLISAHA